ncbi:MAG: SpoIVB peptidase S55 domain-containing protein [Candidatus Sericytochromatia bacterium]
MTKLLPFLAGLSLLAAASSASAAPAPMMPHTELQRGMKGVCRTVFEGSTVEPFQFEIIEIMHGQLGPKRDLILARLQGDKAKYTGVVAGMSGSPCYVNDKLIGALSYRFGQFTKEPIAGITPIADMLTLFQIADAKPAPAQQVYQPPKYGDAVASMQPASSVVPMAGGGTMQAISTPLNFSGFDQRVVEQYRGDLLKLGFQPVMGSSGGVSGNPKAPKQLEMGGAVAGQLVRGDISISGTGTVSYIDGNKVLAFGHPFFNSGHVRIPMATAYIQHILVSDLGSYKMAEDGQEVGTITQDRLTAIGGTLGEHTPMIPVEIKIQDQTNVDPETVKFEVFQDPAMTPMMMAMSINNALSSRLQFNNGGNLSLRGSLRLDGKEIKFNKFYSAPEQGETPSLAAQDLAQTLFALWNNPFRQPRLEQLKLDFSFRPQTMISGIDEVWTEQTEARPGDTVTVSVRLRSFRNETSVRQLKLRIPDDAPYGPLLVLASAGPELDQLEDGLKSGYSSYEALVADLGASRGNNQLYLKLITEEPGMMMYSQLYPKLPGSVLERLDLPENLSHAVPLVRSPGTEVSLPVDSDLQGQRFVRLLISPRGRVLN